MATSSTLELDYRPSYRAAFIVSLATLVLYLVTLAPSTAMWDTSEYIAAAYTLGLPHPPGNPLFVIIGRVFSVLPIASSVAVRINILAAICSAVSAGMWFLVTERVLVGWFPERWQRVLGGVLGALIGATSFTVWNQSVVNEKVYTVSLVGIAIISWLMIRWCDDPDGPKADRILVLVAYLCGLGYANHMAGMLAAPAVGLAILIVRPRTIFRWKLILACVGMLAVGLTPFATQPIRAAYFPAINEGEPTACRTKLEMSCTFSQGTYDAFSYNLNRGQYGKPDLSDRQASLGEQLGMYWLYFKWQWIRDAHEEHPFPQALFAAAFLVLGLFGGWVHFQRDRRSFWYFGSLMFTMTLLLIYYLNFKLGASQDVASQAPHEVRDRDYFFLWSFSAWGVWAALGLLFVWESVAALFGTEQVKVGRDIISLPKSEAWRYSLPVLFIAIVPLFANWHWASRAGHRDTADFAADLLNSVEPYGVLITVGDNDTFPLWYAQEVEGVRRDVIVANTSLLNTDWYVRQIIRRPIYEYDAAKGPAIYRNQTWVRPTTSPIHMSMQDADSVPAYYPLNAPMKFQSGGLSATIDPKNLDHGVLQRADLFVLRMIQDAWPQRPIYFARTSGGYARQLGLGDDVLTQGLAAKVFMPPASPEAVKDTVYIQGDGWLDIPRSDSLWTNVFKGPQSVIHTGDWIDRPSVGIPYLYVATGMELAEALKAHGQPARARQVFEKSKQIATVVRLDDLIRGADTEFAAPTSDTAAGAALTRPAGAPPAPKTNDKAAPSGGPPKVAPPTTPPPPKKPL
ncbi:MAG: glycosyltransferase family 117 protein [Gemmatimonadaceae bacterium]